jgi:thioredoxin 1
MAGWYELSKNDKGQFTFVLKAGNSETILRSEQYESKAAHRVATTALPRSRPTAPATRSRTTPDNPGMTQPYLTEQPLRADIDAMPGAVVLDFGANWCSICNAARPLVDAALAGQTLRHIKVEDGAGRALGRSFGVKLWPTLVFLRDGKEVGKLVRPQSVEAITQELARLA